MIALAPFIAAPDAAPLEHDRCFAMLHHCRRMPPEWPRRSNLLSPSRRKSCWNFKDQYVSGSRRTLSEQHLESTYAFGLVEIIAHPRLAIAAASA
jgi:hypothetical protein